MINRNCVLFAFCFLLLSAVPFYSGDSSDYFPDKTWRTSTPEAQGVPSDMLNAILNGILEKGYKFHGILVVRNGYAVLDASFYPYNPSKPHHVFSVTKSVVSALIGIAIDEGRIESVDRKVCNYFPEWQKPDTGPEKRSVTIADLLSMRSGLKWENPDDNIWYDPGVRNPTAYVLEKPMVSPPGSTFVYNSGNSHLLSAIITKATGKTAAEYAAEKLFKPLGITGYEWKTAADGFSYGGLKLYLKPADMAKFGYLYLMNGKWGNKQVLSSNWVRISTEKKVDPCWSSYDRPYAYHWWGQNFTGYSARGAFGQSIYVLPAANMVVVTIADLPTSEMWDILDGLASSLFPESLKNAGKLPENPKAYHNLLSTVKKLNDAYFRSANGSSGK